MNRSYGSAGLSYYWPRQWYLYNLTGTEAYTWPASYYINSSPTVATPKQSGSPGLDNFLGDPKDGDEEVDQPGKPEIDGSGATKP